MTDHFPNFVYLTQPEDSLIRKGERFVLGNCSEDDFFEGHEGFSNHELIALEDFDLHAMALEIGPTLTNTVHLSGGDQSSRTFVRAFIAALEYAHLVMVVNPPAMRHYYLTYPGGEDHRGRLVDDIGHRLTTYVKPLARPYGAPELKVSPEHARIEQRISEAMSGKELTPNVAAVPDSVLPPTAAEPIVVLENPTQAHPQPWLAQGDTFTLACYAPMVDTDGNTAGTRIERLVTFRVTGEELVMDRIHTSHVMRSSMTDTVRAHLVDFADYLLERYPVEPATPDEQTLLFLVPHIGSDTAGERGRIRPTVWGTFNGAVPHVVARGARKHEIPTE